MSWMAAGSPGIASSRVSTRSALFTPISRVGLIVLDEAHDDSYKQSDPIPLPTYHARDAAIVLANVLDSHLSQLPQQPRGALGGSV